MKEIEIQHRGHTIYAQIYDNGKPPMVLLHGFPDNTHLYDLLVPKLVANYNVIRFDFIGYGRSDKPLSYNYTAISQKEELNTVIKQLGLKKPTIVAHDASGPPAIDWAIENEDKVGKLVLLNSYYSNMPTLRSPEVIWLFSTPVVRNVARFVAKLSNNYIFHKLYYWQVGKFINDPNAREKYVPILSAQFKQKDSAQNAFFKLNEDLITTIKRSTGRIPLLKKFNKQVIIIFGGLDKYLNVGVATEFHNIFPNSTLDIIDNASHFVQMDAPKKIAEIIANSELASSK